MPAHTLSILLSQSLFVSITQVVTNSVSLGNDTMEKYLEGEE